MQEIDLFAAVATISFATMWYVRRLIEWEAITRFAPRQRRYFRALWNISQQPTAKANATVRRMAKMANDALNDED